MKKLAWNALVGGHRFTGVVQGNVLKVRKDNVAKDISKVIVQLGNDLEDLKNPVSVGDLKYYQEKELLSDEEQSWLQVLTVWRIFISVAFSKLLELLGRRWEATCEGQGEPDVSKLFLECIASTFVPLDYLSEMNKEFGMLDIVSAAGHHFSKLSNQPVLQNHGVPEKEDILTTARRLVCFRHALMHLNRMKFGCSAAKVDDVLKRCLDDEDRFRQSYSKPPTKSRSYTRGKLFPQPFNDYKDAVFEGGIDPSVPAWFKDREGWRDGKVLHGINVLHVFALIFLMNCECEDGFAMLRNKTQEQTGESFRAFFLRIACWLLSWTRTLVKPLAIRFRMTKYSRKLGWYENLEDCDRMKFDAWLKSRGNANFVPTVRLGLERTLEYRGRPNDRQTIMKGFCLSQVKSIKEGVQVLPSFVNEPFKVKASNHLKNTTGDNRVVCVYQPATKSLGGASVYNQRMNHIVGVINSSVRLMSLYNLMKEEKFLKRRDFVQKGWFKRTETLRHKFGAHAQPNHVSQLHWDPFENTLYMDHLMSMVSSSDLTDFLDALKKDLQNVK